MIIVFTPSFIRDECKATRMNFVFPSFERKPENAVRRKQASSARIKFLNVAFDLASDARTTSSNLVCEGYLGEQEKTRNSLANKSDRLISLEQTYYAILQTLTEPKSLSLFLLFRRLLLLFHSTGHCGAAAAAASRVT